MKPSAVLFLLGAALLAWTSVSPVGASPDEPGHITYAWGLATGQDVNNPTDVCDPREGACKSRVEVPPGLVPRHGCHVRQPAVTADCVTFHERVSRQTHIVRYPPTFYLPVGLSMRAAHGLGVDGEHLAWVGRMTAAVLGWLVIAPALAAAHRLGPRTLAFSLAILTPTIVFLASSVNPNGIEALGAVAASVGLLCVVNARQLTARNLALTMWGLLWLGWARPMGFLWVGALGLCAAGLLWFGEPEHQRRIRTLVGNYRSLLIGWMALQALTTGWMIYSLGVYRTGPGVGRSMPAGAMEGSIAILFRWGGMFEESIGHLGWLDVQLPQWLLFGFSMGLAAMVVRSSWAGGDRRPWIVLAYLLAIVVGVTLVMLRTKFLWQGRYALPPLVAAFVLWGGVTRDPGDHADERVVRVVAALLWALSCFAGLWVAARYGFGLVVGARFQVPAMSEGSRWSGPLGWPGVITLLAASGVASGLLLRRRNIRSSYSGADLTGPE